ncbi:response regulator SirA [bacterium]|nr:response regulator SirA [candidate division CSSED10-310 bacterium]
MSGEYPITHVIKRDGKTVPFHIDKVVNAIYKAAYAVGGHDREMAQCLAKEVIGHLALGHAPGDYPNVEEIQDLVEKVLIENGHARTAKAFILYREERARIRKEEQPRSSDENVPYRKIWEVLNWNIDHEVESLCKLNAWIESGRFGELVTAADAAFEADVRAAAGAILKKRDSVRLVIIAGPSSSGKTTTTQKLEHYLRKAGLELVALGLDNYFYDLEVHPKDEFGDYDFETPQAMDIELINSHLADLCMGREVGVPVYNFITGRREEATRGIKLEPHQLILIDSLHGLYEPITQGMPKGAVFKIYIETLSQMKNADGQFIRWTDIRLMRRMLRDSKHRNHSPRRTLEHWHYVRNAEKRFIFPYVSTVDHIVNGALVYELPVYKSLLFNYFSYFIDLYKDDPLRSDIHRRAMRVHRMLEQITAWDQMDAVPPDSLIREFIGGGIYEV